MKKIIIIATCLLLTGCLNNSSNISNNKTNRNNNKVEENEIKVDEIKVTINNKVYKINLEKNKTVKEFINILPKELTMNDLNDNEKYANLGISLTTDSYYPKHIEKGDVMLFGDNCLVIFYKSFDTEYDYTKIGHIDNLDDLGNGSIKAIFEK